MKALILAAGLGTRLKPLTNSKPKALIKVGGKSMLQRSLETLSRLGINKIAVNTYHFSDQIEKFIKRFIKNNPELNIELIKENELLETGGGIKNVEYFFDDQEPFLVHNVDIVHNIDLKKMLAHFDKDNTLSLLAVKQQESSRPLLVDEKNYICGHRNKITNEEMIVRKPEGKLKEMRFCGIHLISPKIFNYLGKGHYSIIPKYLDIIKQGLIVSAFDIGKSFYFDIGTPERIKEAEQMLRDLKI